MPQKIAKPYGLWESPITPEYMAAGKRLGDVQWDSDSRTLVWLEGRSGQSVLVAQGLNGDAPADINDGDSVRAYVGYGGGDFCASQGHVYYSGAETRRLHRAPIPGGRAEAITPEFGGVGAPTVSPDGRWIAFVHTYEREDSIGVAQADGRIWPQKLTSGADFYMWPVWHPSGGRMAWVEWDHPNMPWDGTRLVLATLAYYTDVPPIVTERVVLVGEEDVAVSEPRFSPGGRYLVYTCDRSGYKNLYAYDLSTGEHAQLTDHDAEIGGPAWGQGNRSFVPIPGNRVIYVRTKDHMDSLWSVRITGDEPAPLATPLARYTHFGQLAISPDGKRLAAIASAPEIPPRIVSITLEKSAPERIHARTCGERALPSQLSGPEAVSWQSPDGDTVYGLYYPPRNPRYQSSGKPPAIIMVHGGPTGDVSMSYDDRAQFFATRGFGVLQIDYRGSTGHGKAYMAKLRGNWGVYDVEDTVGGARFLADSGRVDPDRLVVMGGSAGGYTVWLALATHPGFFRAGICLYGVSNLFSLAASTHKFEERYLDSLVGPLPEAAPIYHERSVVFHAPKIVDPVAVFQGDEDKVVPKEQSDTIVESLARRGVSHEYHVYEGEGHGWRKAETIEQFYEDVMRFLRQYVIYA